MAQRDGRSRSRDYCTKAVLTPRTKISNPVLGPVHCCFAGNFSTPIQKKGKRDLSSEWSSPIVMLLSYLQSVAGRVNQLGQRLPRPRAWSKNENPQASTTIGSATEIHERNVCGARTVPEFIDTPSPNSCSRVGRSRSASRRWSGGGRNA